MERLGRYIGALFAVMLAAATMQVQAAQQVGRDFNHATTGFVLSGGHAAAACETCHIGGVFKGTPRACDGCHAVGKRVVATPKNDRHIVTDAPCDTCHFNTATWLGARYNHGSAVVGQCASCHNGRQAAGRPASHSGNINKSSKSCDQCHRTFAWNPASWNHTNSIGSCDQSGCHVAGQNTWYKGVSTAHTRTGMATYACTRCHNYVKWSPAPYDHVGASSRCLDCHTGTIAIGTPAGHVAIGTSDCSECHINTTRSWTPALGAKPSNHIPYNAGVACTTCHTAATGLVNVTVLHNNSTASYTCADCHISPTPYSGNNQKTRKSHDGSSGNNCTGCHTHRSSGSYGSWGG